MITHTCVKCGKDIARAGRPTKGRRRKEPELVALNGALVVPQPAGQAPRVRCPCGTLHIIVKGQQ